MMSDSEIQNFISAVDGFASSLDTELNLESSKNFISICGSNSNLQFIDPKKIPHPMKTTKRLLQQVEQSLSSLPLCII